MEAKLHDEPTGKNALHNELGNSLLYSLYSTHTHTHIHTYTHTHTNTHTHTHAYIMAGVYTRTLILDTHCQILPGRI